MIEPTETGHTGHRLTPEQMLVREVARSYILERIRLLASGHQTLFEGAMRLFSLIEDEFQSDPSEAHDRYTLLRSSPTARTIMKLVSSRMQHIVDAGMEVIADNRRIFAILDRWVTETGGDRTEIERQYREVLVAEVPLERSLRNVAAIVDLTRLAHSMLSAEGLVKRALRHEAFSFVRNIVIRRPEVRSELDSLWDTLRADPERVRQLADQIERHGPSVVHDIYDGEADHSN